MNFSENEPRRKSFRICFLKVEKLQPAFNLSPRFPVHKKCILVWFSCAGLSCESLFELWLLTMHVSSISLHQWRPTLWWAVSLKHKQLNSMCNCKTKDFSCITNHRIFSVTLQDMNFGAKLRAHEEILKHGLGYFCLSAVVSTFSFLPRLTLRLSLLCLPLCPLSIHWEDTEAHELGFAT